MRRLFDFRIAAAGRLAVLAALVLLLTPAAYAHMELVRTAPEADAAVSAPSEIRLWFTEAPQMRGTSIRLADAAGQLVASTAPSADPGDAKQVFIRPDAALRAGTYTVHWRVIAQDGHAMNGTFTFRVRAE